MAYVYDLREDVRDQLAIAQTIGGGLGAAFGYRAAQKEKERQLLEEQVLKNTELAVIQTIAAGSANNWSRSQIHDSLMQIPDAVRTTTFRNFAMGRYGASQSTGLGAPNAQIEFWQKQKSIAIQNDDKRMEQLADQQIEAAIKRVNPEFQMPQEPVEPAELDMPDKKKIDKPGVFSPFQDKNVRPSQTAVIDFKEDKEIEELWKQADQTPGEPQSTEGRDYQAPATKDYGYPEPKKPKTLGEAVQKHGQRELELAKQTLQKSPYPEYPDAFYENGKWYVYRDGKRYRIED